MDAEGSLERYPLATFEEFRAAARPPRDRRRDEALRHAVSQRLWLQYFDAPEEFQFVNYLINLFSFVYFML